MPGGEGWILLGAGVIVSPMDLLLGMMLVAGGAALGAAGVYIWSQRGREGTSSQITTLKTEAALAAERAAAADADLRTARQEHQLSLDKVDAARRDAATAQARVAALEAELDAGRRNIAEQARLLDDANQRLTASFAAVSREALEKSNAAFLQMAEAKFKTLSTEAAGTLETRKAQIGVLLKPLEEMLKTYQLRLGELEQQRTDAYASLRQQIGVMSATQAALSTQTSQLISALTKPSVRGQWGEVALRRLVELAGMTARCDFTEQFITGAPGEESRLRPDMVVHMPADREVVVDCKTVLAAFLDAAAAPDEPARQQHLRRHATLVRNRAKELASKSYWSQFDQMPEFVVLFLPGEAFLYAACEQDPSLIESCIADRVILATPTTLIALLKSIEYGWRQQAVSENAAEIRRLGGELYERLATLADNMARVGTSLEGAVEAFNRTVGTLESRVLVSARRMGELGARNEKQVPDVEPVEKQIRSLASSLFE
jgi:DNA recombination protein RmuC